MRAPAFGRQLVEHGVIFGIQRRAAYCFAICTGKIAAELCGLICVFIAVQRKINAGNFTVIYAVVQILRTFRSIYAEAKLFKVLRALYILKGRNGKQRRIVYCRLFYDARKY